MNPTTLLSGLGAAITADPTLGGASTTGRDSSGGGDLFLALVAGLLQGDSQGGLGTISGPATAAPETPGESTDPASGLPVLATPDGAVVPAAPDETDPAAEVPDANGTAVAVLPITLAVPPLVAQATALAAPAAGGSEATATAPASADVTTAASPTAPTPTLVASGQSGQAGADGNPGGSDGSGQPGDQSPIPAPAPDPAPASTDADAAPAAGPAGPRVDARIDVVPTQSAGVPSAAAVAPTTTLTAVATPAASADLPRVADQVFPEVLRATTNAENGTSRVTIKLNPESLGEVRVVLIQRGGELEVSLAAGTDARRALTDGASELRRLLESVGRPDSRILIRDLPNGPLAPVAPNAPSMRTDVSTDLAGGPWSGAGGPGGEPAPDREQSRHHPGSSTATDGIPTATLGSRPTTTTSRSHVGLDLSM